MPETPGPTRLFALRWTDRSSRFFDALKAPYVQPCRKQTPPDNPDKTLGLELPYATPACTSAKIKTDKAGVPASSLDQSIPFYGPTSRWRWVDGLPLVHIDDIPVTRDCKFTIEITTSKIGGREIRHLSKTWSTSKEQGTFSSELALYKDRLRPLQGIIVPNVIGVYSTQDRVRLVTELPHQSFWIEASPDMPDVLKVRCIEAFQMLHAHGVCHGDAKLSNILIGGDARVTLTNFQSSRAIIPGGCVREASPSELEVEMHRVKYILDYQGASRQDQVLPNSTPHHHMGLGYDSDLECHNSVPERFILPDQSAMELHIALNSFLSLVERMELMEFRPQLPDLPNRPYSSHEPIVVPSIDANPPKYSLRKRNNVLMPDSCSLHKRARTVADDDYMMSTSNLRRSRDSRLTSRKPTQTTLPLHKPIIHRRASGVTSAVSRPLPRVKVRDFAYESQSHFQSHFKIHPDSCQSCKGPNPTWHLGLRASPNPVGNPTLRHGCKSDDVLRNLDGGQEGREPHRKRKQREGLEDAAPDLAAGNAFKKPKLARISCQTPSSNPEISIAAARSSSKEIPLASPTMGRRLASDCAFKNHPNDQRRPPIPTSDEYDSCNENTLGRAAATFQRCDSSDRRSGLQNNVSPMPNDGFLAMSPSAMGWWVSGGIARLLF